MSSTAVVAIAPNASVRCHAYLGRQDGKRPRTTLQLLDLCKVSIAFRVYISPQIGNGACGVSPVDEGAEKRSWQSENHMYCILAPIILRSSNATKALTKAAHLHPIPHGLVIRCASTNTHNGREC